MHVLAAGNVPGVAAVLAVLAVVGAAVAAVLAVTVTAVVVVDVAVVVVLVVVSVGSIGQIRTPRIRSGSVASGLPSENPEKLIRYTLPTSVHGHVGTTSSFSP